MADHATTARPYAKALFELATQHQTIDAWYDVLRVLADIIDHPDVGPLLHDPNINANQWQQFLLDIIKTAAKHAAETIGDTELNQALELFIRVDRLTMLPALCRLYREQQLLATKQMDVEVLSVTPLTAIQQNTLQKNLATRFAAHIVMHYQQDAHLIGGLVIRTNQGVIDCSIRGALIQLATNLKQGVNNL